MKLTTTERPAALRLAIRLGWFIGIWSASVAVLYAIAYGLRKIILG